MQYIFDLSTFSIRIIKLALANEGLTSYWRHLKHWNLAARTSTNNKCTSFCSNDEPFSHIYTEERKHSSVSLQLYVVYSKLNRRFLTFQCPNSNLDSRFRKSFEKSHSTIDDTVSLDFKVCCVLSTLTE